MVFFKCIMFPWRRSVSCVKPNWVVSKRFRKNMSTNVPDDYLVWMDLEMTGLDENVHHIIEVACIITNMNLEKIGSGIDVIVHQTEKTHDESTAWPLVHHKKSGLRDASINSPTSIEEADNLISTYINTSLGANKRNLYLSGNSVYMDKRFIDKYMPLVSSLLHYRILDVSSIKILYHNWLPNGTSFKKSFDHRALSDISESIEELKFYREAFFRTNQTEN